MRGEKSKVGMIRKCQDAQRWVYVNTFAIASGGLVCFKGYTCVVRSRMLTSNKSRDHIQQDRCGYPVTLCKEKSNYQVFLALTPNTFYLSPLAYPHLLELS